MFTNKEIADTNELGTFQKVNKTNGPLRSLAERGAHSGAVLTPHLDRTGSGFELTRRVEKLKTKINARDC